MFFYKEIKKNLCFANSYRRIMFSVPMAVPVVPNEVEQPLLFQPVSFPISSGIVRNSSGYNA